jgi:hypothetical protein
MAEITLGGKPVQVDLLSVTLAQISGPDMDIRSFLEGLGHETDTPVDLDAWHADALRAVYLQFPLVLLERKAGYVYVGSGRTYRLAQSIFDRDELIPALIIRGARISAARKLLLLAAELLGLPALTRTRRLGPRRLLGVWWKLSSLGVETIRGESEADFGRGTGYSRKALVLPTEEREGDHLVRRAVQHITCAQRSAGARP